MKLKKLLLDTAKVIYLGILAIILFFLASALMGGIWFILLKYLDFLLGVFPENIPLTITIFCATVCTIIFGGSLYVSSR